MQTLIENVKEVEAKKRTLEEAVDTLNEQLAKQTAKERLQMDDMKDKEKKHAKGMMDAQVVKTTLESQMQNHRDTHTKQLTNLRDEIQDQTTIIQDLKDMNQRKELEEIQIKGENEKLNGELTKLKTKYHELELLTTKKEHAQKDLQGLEETVAKELATLNKLRQMFVKDLQSRMKVISGEENVVDEANSQAQKQKISFLENNLEQLTKVHKQLVRDNADLRLELPKLEKRLKATQERVKALETALKDAKDGAMKDRSRYQKEVERLKQKSSSNRRVHQPQIAKPIRPGQQLTSSAIIRPNGNVNPDGTYDSTRQQGSVVVRSSSPSKIPIIPLNSSQPPIIKGMGYRDNSEMSVGGSGVSQRVKNSVGTEQLTRSRIRKPGDEAKRSSIHGDSILTINGPTIKGGSSTDRLNESNGSSSASPKNSRRLPSPSNRSPLSQNSSLSGREAEIQALMSGGRLPRSNSQNNQQQQQSGQQSGDGPWERRNVQSFKGQGSR